MSNLIEICVQLSLILFYKNYFFHLIHTNFTHTPFAEICRISKTTFYNSIFFFNFYHQNHTNFAYPHFVKSYKFHSSHYILFIIISFISPAQISLTNPLSKFVVFQKQHFIILSSFLISIIKITQISLTHILSNLTNSTPPTISSLLLFLSSHPHKFHLLLFYRILLKFLSCIPLSNLLNFIFSSNLN